MNKKGQAAMEFLMTYGWAILVVLAAIAALAYFGVLNPSKSLPSSCTIAPGISCDDFKVSPTSVDLVLRNGMGSDLTNLTVSIAGCASDTQALWSDGATSVIELMGCTQNGGLGSRFKGDLTLTYVSGSGLSHTKTGVITTKVE